MAAWLRRILLAKMYRYGVLVRMEFPEAKGFTILRAGVIMI